MNNLLKIISTFTFIFNNQFKSNTPLIKQNTSIDTREVSILLSNKLYNIKTSLPLNQYLNQQFWIDKDLFVYLNEHNYSSGESDPVNTIIGRIDDLVRQPSIHIKGGNLIIKIEMNHSKVIQLLDTGQVIYIPLDTEIVSNDDEHIYQDSNQDQNLDNAKTIAYIMETLYTFSLYDLNSKRDIAKTKIPILNWINSVTKSNEIIEKNDSDSNSIAQQKNQLNNLITDNILHLAPLNVDQNDKFKIETNTDEYFDHFEFEDEDYNNNIENNYTANFQIVLTVLLLIQLFFAIIGLIYIIKYLKSEKLNKEKSNNQKNEQNYINNENKNRIDNNKSQQNLKIIQLNDSILNENDKIHRSNFKNQYEILSPSIEKIEQNPNDINNYMLNLKDKDYSNPPAISNNIESNQELINQKNTSDQIKSNKCNNENQKFLNDHSKNNNYGQNDINHSLNNNPLSSNNLSNKSSESITNDSDFSKNSQKSDNSFEALSALDSQFIQSENSSCVNDEKLELDQLINKNNEQIDSDSAKLYQNVNSNNDNSSLIPQSSSYINYMNNNQKNTPEDQFQNDNTNYKFLLQNIISNLPINTALINKLNSAKIDDKKFLTYYLQKIYNDDPNLQKLQLGFLKQTQELTFYLDNKTSDLNKDYHSKLLMKMIQIITLPSPKNISTKSIQNYMQANIEDNKNLHQDYQNKYLEDDLSKNNSIKKLLTQKETDRNFYDIPRKKSQSPKMNNKFYKCSQNNFNNKIQKNTKQELRNNSIQAISWSNVGKQIKNNIDKPNFNFNNSRSKSMRNFNHEPAYPFKRKSNSSSDSDADKNPKNIQANNTVNVEYKPSSENLNIIKNSIINQSNFDKNKSEIEKKNIYEFMNDDSDISSETDESDSQSDEQIIHKAIHKSSNESIQSNKSIVNQNQEQKPTQIDVNQKLEIHNENELKQDSSQSLYSNTTFQNDDMHEKMQRKRSTPNNGSKYLSQSKSKDLLTLNCKSQNDLSLSIASDKQQSNHESSSNSINNDSNKIAQSTDLTTKSVSNENSIIDESDDQFLSKHHKFLGHLGSGGFGCVSHFTDKLGLDQAVKRIRIAQQRGQQLKDLDEVNEICILHKCSHPNIVKIHQYWFENLAQDEQFKNEADESQVLLGSVKNEISKSNHIASQNEVGFQQDSESEYTNKNQSQKFKNSKQSKNSISRQRVQKKYGLNHIYLYIKMEQIDGQVLGDFKPLFSSIPKADQYHIIRQILDALIQTHTNMNIGHRDVKPENIMVIRHDVKNNMAGMYVQGDNESAKKSQSYTNKYSIKLLDFGISKFINDNPSQNVIEGTSLWISPEQEKGAINFKSDMFSQGLVLFWLFSKSTETGQREIFNKIRMGQQDQGRRVNIPDEVLNIVRLICIDRINSWELTNKDEWVQLKNYLLNEQKQINEM